MSTDTQLAMKELQKQIYEYDYYVAMYHSTLGLHQMTPIGVRLCTYKDDEVVEMCHNFWSALPDNASIRRKPFWLLCDIAENIFNDEADSEGGGI